MPQSFHSLFKTILLLVSLALISACSSLPNGPSEGDPFESYNRAMFSFNDGLDQYLLKPVAEGYDAALPSPVKTGVSNFFSNIGDIFVILNDLLQFKFTQAIQDTSRFVFNSTIGLYGLIDVATPMGLPKHHEDFGQTLATWGVGDGPYIVLPFLGSSTLRDTAGIVVDSTFDPVYAIEDDDTRNATIVLRTIDTRVRLLKASRIAEQAAIDKYSFFRDAYLQHRKNAIYDGNPPEEPLVLPESSDEDLELELELGL
ncbi:MAG: VacJ family lipoprotein [Woeseiaceae bacterium]